MNEADSTPRYDVASHQVVFSWLDIHKATCFFFFFSEGRFGRNDSCWNVYIEADHVEFLKGILSNGNKDEFEFKMYCTTKAQTVSTSQYTFQGTWVWSMKGSDWNFLRPRNPGNPWDQGIPWKWLEIWRSMCWSDPMHPNESCVSGTDQLSFTRIHHNWQAFDKVSSNEAEFPSWKWRPFFLIYRNDKMRLKSARLWVVVLVIWHYISLYTLYMFSCFVIIHK